MNIQTKPPAAGTNRPALVTGEDLAKAHAALAGEVEAIEKHGEDAPPVIEDDEDLALINKIIADCRDQDGKVDRTRDAEKRPYLEAGRVIDGFFKGLSARAIKVKGALEQRVTRYLNKKADEERRAREKAARLAREEANRLAREAAEIAAREAAEREAAAKVESTTIAPTDPIPAPPPIRSTAAMGAAVAANARADIAETAAAAKPSDLARTRTDGGTATLVDDWRFEITNYAEIDLAALRPFLSRPDVEKAIRKFVDAHKDTMPLTGVRVFNSPKARVV